MFTDEHNSSFFLSVKSVGNVCLHRSVLHNHDYVWEISLKKCFAFQIHLRAGARDKGLFYFTTGLLFTVIGLSAQGWYTMAMKGR